MRLRFGGELSKYKTLQQNKTNPPKNKDKTNSKVSLVTKHLIADSKNASYHTKRFIALQKTKTQKAK